MADNDNRCPLCGKNTNEGETFCGDCQEIAQNAYPEELLSNKRDSEPMSGEEEKADPDIENENPSYEEKVIDKSIEENLQRVSLSRSNKTLFIFVAVGLVFMLLLGVVGLFMKNKDEEATESAYWSKCIEENTPLSYSKYLVHYPEGSYSGEAQSKIMELREKEREEWEALRKSGNIDALFSFLSDHPQTPYERQIKHVVDSLGWLQAMEQNTADAYQAYLDNVKIGRFTGEYQDMAEGRLDYLIQLKAVEGDELKDVEKVLSGFFKALSSGNNKDIQKHSASVLLKFFGKENQLSTVIADSLKADFKVKKINSVSYVLPPNLPEIIKDNKSIYFATLPIKVETTFADRKKKKQSSEHIFNIELDGEKRIRSVYMKGK
ncbi:MULTISPECIES: hypothetical protein [unclassified Dysgonomonas]|jgi:hypothetical protein|uniref:hypothetical protein n=1 Tax=unclassified Dysgonomonas TaxID=2630389 RepID=UPI0025C3D410|nr:MULTISPECIES: hypothetical protein [unclassified Dysgonomonas]MDR2002030.1 hypothetical protein [Prevotella sp.]HMM02763.1 hypothetical protein [Dysgonomonas sp.]